MTGQRLGWAVVTGRSMEPTLHDGDLLLVRYGALPRPGLAIVRLPPGPDGPRPLAVKRITGAAPDEPGRWWVERDNPHEGVDSWLVGSLASQDVVATVILRMPPTGRRMLSRLPGFLRRRVGLT